MIIATKDARSARIVSTLEITVVAWPVGGVVSHSGEKTGARSALKGQRGPSLGGEEGKWRAEENRTGAAFRRELHVE